MSVKNPTAKVESDAPERALGFLRRMQGFRDCSSEVLQALVASGKVSTLGRHEALVQGSRRFDYMSLVLAGSLEASLLRNDGHRHLIYFVQPGELAGLIPLVDEGLHLYDLRALASPTTVFLLPGESVRSLARQHTSVSLSLAQNLALRSRLLHERLSADSSLDLRVRLAKLLLTLAKMHSMQTPEGALIEMKINQTDLGDWLGVSRQSANLAIQALRQEKLIRHDRSRLLVCDPARLAAVAESGWLELKSVR